jgi:hypothetical protein
LFCPSLTFGCPWQAFPTRLARDNQSRLYSPFVNYEENEVL